MRVCLLTLLLVLAVASGVAAQDASTVSQQMRTARHAGHPEQALEVWQAAPRSLRADERVVGERIQTLLDLGRDADALATRDKLALPADSGLDDLAPPLAVAETRVRRLRGDGAGAGRLVEGLLLRRPGLVDARLVRVELLADAGRWADARSELLAVRAELGARRQAELDAALLAREAQDLLGDDVQLDRAVALLEQAAATAPWRADVVALRVQALLRWQRVEEAEQVARAALAAADEETPRVVELHFALGAVHRAAERHDEARACFERVLTTDPLHAEAKVALARGHARDGRHEQALALLDEVLADSPGHLDALLVRADLAEDEGDLAAAEASLREVLQHRPQHLKTLWCLSRLLARQGQMSQVDELLERYEARRQQLASR